MSWAFFVAGTPATVVSQWKVESGSTTEMMTEFHRRRRAEPGSSFGTLFACEMFTRPGLGGTLPTLRLLWVVEGASRANKLPVETRPTAALRKRIET